MRLFRQLGTWGTALALAPVLWLLSCALARTLGQHAYDAQIVSATRTFRTTNDLPIGDLVGWAAEKPVKDPRVLAEIQKYLQVWSLEPGACAAFPDAARFPWCWNPFRPSALIMRLKQKQAFLLTQQHVVRRKQFNRDRVLFYLSPDPQAALGGRYFLAETKEGLVVKVVER